MIGTSEKVVKLHKNRRDLITDYLSSLIIDTTGSLIFNNAINQEQAVIWLGHQILAKELAKLKT